MKLTKQRRGLVAALAALVVVGALWAGVPAGTLLILALVLACPLMMLTMHGSGHGTSAHGGRSAGTDDAAKGDPHAAHRHRSDPRPR